MIASLGSLVVEVAANVARFQSDMGRVAQIAEGAMARVTQTSVLASNALKTVGGALAGALAISALREFAARTIESTASLKDLAEKTGASVENLSALRSVARIGGRDIGDIGDAMVKLTKNLAGTDETSKGAAQAVQDLGLNLATFRRLDAAEQLKALADRMVAFRDNTAKTAIALELFGKNGANLLPFLKDLAQTGELVGKVTADQAEQADQYEKNLRKLAAAAEEFKKKLVIDALPALNDITAAMVQARKESGLLMSLWVGLGGVFAKSTIGQMFNADGSADQINKAVQQAFEIKKLTDALDYNIRRAGEGGESGARAAKSVAAIRARLEELSSQALKTSADLKKAVNDPFKEPPKPSLPDRADKTQPRAKTDGERFIEQLQRQVQQQEKGRTEMLRLEAAQKGVSAAAAPYIRRLEEMEARNRRIAKTVEEVAEAETQRAKVGEVVTGGNELAKQLIQQTDLLGINAREQRRVTELRKLDETVLKALAGANFETRIEILKLADTMRGNLIRALDDLEEREKAVSSSFSVGAVRAFEAYRDAAMDNAKAAENFIGGSLNKLEDAFVDFAKTGKLSFSSLFSFMAEEFLRQQIRMATASVLPGGGGGFLSALGSVFGPVGAFIGSVFTPHAEGLPYVPYDGYPAVLHQGERVLTRQENSAGRNVGPTVDARIGAVNVGQGVSRGEVHAAINQALGKQMVQIQRLVYQDKMR